MPTEIIYEVSGRRVAALADGEVIGHVYVPDITFHWGDGVFVPLAGIGGVMTDERFRRRGVASRMMKEAVELARRCGYGGSGVSTGMTNVARRLYSKAGYVHLFSMHRYSRRLEEAHLPAPPPGVTIRPYEERDLNGVLALIEQTERPFFGSRKKSPKRWKALRARSAGRAPALAFVAERGGRIVGFADRRVHWEALTGEVFAEPGPDRFALGEALVAALERAAVRLGEQSLCFWATDCEDFPVRMLLNRGYELTTSRVFQFNILSLQRLMEQLEEALVRRAARLDTGLLPASIELRYNGEAGKVDLGGPGQALELRASRDVVTNVICGIYSAWDAYLRGVMDIGPSLGPEQRRALEALFPAVPYHHPPNDWW